MSNLGEVTLKEFALTEMIETPSLLIELDRDYTEFDIQWRHKMKLMPKAEDILEGYLHQIEEETEKPVELCLKTGPGVTSRIRKYIIQKFTTDLKLERL